jgi:D-inositol-3-phosphate glycosyltransferase
MEKQKKKLLWIGDAVATTGFARVTHAICDRLKDNYDISVLGINYYGDPHPFKYDVYPASTGGDLWGFNRVVNIIKKLKPDIIMILNDPWVIQNYLAQLIQNKIKDIPVVVYFPVDATEHDPDWYRDYKELVRATCVYTEFGKKVVLDTERVFPENIHIVPHGVDTRVFYQFKDLLDKKGNVLKTGTQIAREQLYPMKDKPEFNAPFIILNANRNQPRKRIDITIRAFSVFAKDKPSNVKLYLHMGMRDAGVDVVKLAKRYGFEDRLVITALVNNIPGISDDRLNVIYNATEVGINTSMGEGWGLTNWEHATAGKIQIVPDHSACAELWKDKGILIPTIADFMYEGTNTVGRIPSLDGTVQAMQLVYEDWLKGGEMVKELGEAGRKMVTGNEYNWDVAAKRVGNILANILNEKIPDGNNVAK